MQAFAQDEILFFPGEDPEAIRQAFIELWAEHGDRFDTTVYAKHVFRGLREPDLRAGQAARRWESDFGVVEAVRAIRNKEVGAIDTSPNTLIRHAMSVADNPRAEHKDVIAALAFVARVQGYFKKEVDLNVASANTGNGDLLAAIVKRLPN